MAIENSETIKESLVELNRQIAYEEQQGEPAHQFFETHLSDQLIFHRANGKVVGKGKFLEELKNNPFKSRVAEAIDVTLLDDRALVTLIVIGTRADDGSVHYYRNIRLFARSADQWLLEFWYNYELDQTKEVGKLNFIIDDYKSKVDYLKDHFTRLWNRFNYFLGLQSALFGAAMLSPEKFSLWIPVFAAILCIPWYIFGAQDRYLVALYRKQIERVVIKIKSRLQLSEYYFVGQTEDIEGQSEKLKTLGIESKLYQWRNPNISTTKLAALFPLIILIMWIIIWLFLIKT